MLPKNSRYKYTAAQFKLEGYELFPDKFPIDNSRGILIYVKSTYSAVEITPNTHFKESVWLKVCLNKSENLLFGCIYKSPSSCDQNQDNLNALLNEMCSMNISRLLVTGDFNFPGVNWETWTGGG